MQSFDISPLFRTSTLFDRLWDNTPFGFEATGFPDYDLVRTGDEDYRITMAVPGFRDSEITVESNENTLWISGRKEVEVNDDTQYVHRGLVNRNFQRTFRLPEHMKVVAAKLEAGMLHIALRREIPAELQPRKIEIVTDEKPRLEEPSVSTEKSEAA